MTNREQAIREIAEKWGFLQDKTDEGFLIDNDRTKQCLSDLTALIEEHYVKKDAYIALENTLAKAEAKNLELLRQRDELKEALAEQKRLYFNLFDEEIRCMYCEAEISRGSAIILCKECAENTEL